MASFSEFFIPIWFNPYSYAVSSSFNKTECPLGGVQKLRGQNFGLFQLHQSLNPQTFMLPWYATNELNLVLEVDL